jgi:predicted restriction endonuclease
MGGDSDMPMLWEDATKQALLRFAERNNTVVISRQLFIQQELNTIIENTQTKGATPSQTLSRVLQDLREDNVLFFSEQAGKYTLVQDIKASSEDLPDDVLENAIQQNKLLLDDVNTGESLMTHRVRRGTSKLREMTLKNYQSCCALCDIADSKLLVTSHIVPWASAPEIRGRLDNVICFCTLHDKLFETGYFSILDDYQLTWRTPIVASALIKWQKNCTTSFNKPLVKIPKLDYLAQHRQAHGFTHA